MEKGSKKWGEPVIQISIRFPESTYKLLELCAEQQNNSINHVVIKMIQKGLESNQTIKKDSD